MTCINIDELRRAHNWFKAENQRMLRDEHKRAVLGVGVNIHRELRFRFEVSAYRRAWLIDGTLAGLGGVTGTMLAPAGYVWFALTQRALRYPIAVVKEARRQLDTIMTVKNELATVILPQDAAAMRLAVFLGFHVADKGLGSPAHTRLERHALRRYLEAAHELRIPMAGGEAIPVGYHHEAA